MWISLAQGLSVFAAVLAVYLFALSAGHTAADVRGLTFATLVFGNLGLILVNRSWTRSAVSGLASDPNASLGWVLGGALGCLALLLLVPPLRELFRFEAFSAGDLVGVIVASAAGVAWFEVYKYAKSRRKGSVSGG